MSNLIQPHGSNLVEAVLHGRAAEALQRRASHLPSVDLDARAVADLELVASGGATPVRGFMGHADYRSVLDRQQLATGMAFPVPLVLPVPISALGTFRYGSEVALRDAEGELRGAVIVRDTFVRDRRHEARVLHGTDDANDSSVAELLARPAGTVGGEVVLLRSRGARFDTAREVRLRLAANGLSRVAAAVGIAAAEAARAAVPHAEALLVGSLAEVASIPPGFSIVVARLPFGGGSTPLTSREFFLHALALRNFGVTHLVLGPAHLDLGSAHALARVRGSLGLAFVEGAAAVSARFPAAGMRVQYSGHPA